MKYDQAEFDRVADAYRDQHKASTRLAGENLDYFAWYKVAHITREWGDRTQPKHILDFGAGIGNSLPHLRAAFPASHITALDVSRVSLDRCDALELPATVTLHYDGTSIPLAEGSVDLAFTSCVFHHIEPTRHISLLAEIRRILSPQGRFLLFEHNPLNPLTRHAVANCPFDADAVLIGAREMAHRCRIAGFDETRITYRLFFPGALASLRPVERWLGWLPLGAQYSITAS